MEIREENKFYSDIIYALMKEYEAVLVVSYDGSMRPLRIDKSVVQTPLMDECLKTRDYRLGLNRYIDLFLDREEIKEQARASADFDNILKILEHKSSYKFNFLQKQADGGLKYYQTAYYKLPDNSYDAFLLGLRNLDEVMQDERDRLENLSEHQKKQSELNEKLQENQRKLEENISLIKSMNKIYFMSYYIDLESDTFTTIQEYYKVSRVLGTHGNATEAMKKIAGMIKPSDDSTPEDARRFVDLTTINERLKGKDVITQDYLAMTLGYCQAAMIAGERDSEGNLKTVFMACRKIHEEKQRELEYKEKMQMQLDEINALNAELAESTKRAMLTKGILEGLSREYHTVWICDKETLQTHLVRSSGISTIQDAVKMGLDDRDYDIALQKYVKKYVVPEDRKRVAREIYSAEVLRQIEKNGFYSVNYLRRTDDGNVGYHQLVFANISGESGAHHFTYAFRDIDAIIRNEQKKQQELENALQAAEKANEAKTSFLNNMSHDIRTPMNAILGFAGLMHKELHNPELMENYLTKIKSSGEYLLDIINNVLDMARIESGKMTVDESFFSFESDEYNIIPVFDEVMRKRKLNFVTDVKVKNHYLMLDISKTQQILVNLLSNAAKYTPEGGKVELIIQELPCEKRGYTTIRTIISDTGVGMSQEFMETIFDAFTREKNTTESKVAGTGLGMAIVKKLVELMGGTIKVESELGKGTTFTVTLTHRLIENPEYYLTEDNEDNEALNCDYTGKRILLAEDNELNAEIASMVLEDKGFAVDLAVDGVECLKMFTNAEAGYYDLILMDIQMPNMDGYEATKQIRRLEDKAKAAVPIIAMTANAFEEDRRHAEEAGMNDHIAKPFELNLLMKKLAAVLV